MSKIKVVDIACVGLKVEKPSIEDFMSVGKELSAAFEEIGFVFVSNHGVDEHIINNAKVASLDYFKLSSDVKGVKEKGSEPNVYQGWVKPGKEIFDQDEKGLIASLELRESFDMNDFGPKAYFPDEHVSTFRPSMTSLAKNAKLLTFRILKSLSVVLGKEEDFLGDMHRLEDAMKMRTLYYPPIPTNLAYKEGLVRLGQHSDYDTCTLLFQDQLGGLEVKDAHGKWVSASPKEGTVLINIGDFLEMLTRGSWPATHHRVVVPQEELRRSTCRQSIVLFVDPDPEVVFQPLGGPSDEYPPVKAGEYLNMRRSQTYK